jgi:hypothetical protein
MQRESVGAVLGTVQAVQRIHMDSTPEGRALSVS